MNWDYDEIVKSLYNDYCIHYKNYHKYEVNDNDIDRTYEMAKCDYIFDKLRELTGATPTEIADNIDDLLEDVFYFDPQSAQNNFPIKNGTVVCLMQDVLYSDYDSFCSGLDEDDLSELLENVVEVSGSDVYIPKGTHMTFKGVEPGASGWPVFDIHGFEFDFAGDPFKIKVVK